MADHEHPPTADSFPSMPGREPPRSDGARGDADD
jgi:hypothetical protein